MPNANVVDIFELPADLKRAQNNRKWTSRPFPFVGDGSELLSRFQDLPRMTPNRPMPTGYHTEITQRMATDRPMPTGYHTEITQRMATDRPMPTGCHTANDHK